MSVLFSLNPMLKYKIQIFKVLTEKKVDLRQRHCSNIRFIMVYRTMKTLQANNKILGQLLTDTFLFALSSYVIETEFSHINILLNKQRNRFNINELC